ncbi:MAG: phytoene/squalene synthase family protein [Alphaproteobacteria bacterium]
MPTLSYVAEQVRRFDHDRYLTALFAPDSRREDLLALYAFNIEIAKTREVVSERLLGEIRLQWWRDAVTAIGAGDRAAVPVHEIVAALARAIGRHDLPLGDVQRLIDARAFDLEDEAPEDLDSLERYGEETSALVVALALRSLGAWSEEMAPLARHAGLAHALAGLIRAVPFHARQKRLYLPRDLTRALDVGALFELRPSAALAEAVLALASRARSHIEAARSLARTAPRAGLAALLVVTLADADLRRIERASGNPFDPRLAMGPTARQMRLALAALRRRP